MLPPGRAKLATKPLATGSATCAKMIGMSSRLLQQSRRVGRTVGKNEVGTRRDQFPRELLSRFRVAGHRPARVDTDIAALGPAELLKFVPERGNVGLSLRVALGIRHKSTDPSHDVSLLRARRERPRSRRAAEQRDELASSHVEHRGLPPQGAREQSTARRRAGPLGQA